MKYLFRGGTVVSGRGTRRADVLVEDEKILRVARSISAPEATVIDVEGQLLLPGFIDAHTHFDLDVCNTTTVDDFFSGSRSAYCLICMISRKRSVSRAISSLGVLRFFRP